MSETTEISPVFYKIGKLEALPKAKDLDPAWRVFDSLELAVNDQMNWLSASLGRRFLQMPDTYQDTATLENTQLQGFLESFGYIPEAAVLRRVSKDHFTILADLEGAQVLEIFKWYDFEKDLDSLNKRDRISVETIIVASPTGKSIILIEPSTTRGFLKYYSQASGGQPVHIQSHPVEVVRVPALGAVSNPKSNQYAALELLHERGHVAQRNIQGYAAEVDASEYALTRLKAIEAQGIDLTPRIQPGDERRYLERHLLGYAKRHHPFRTFFHTRVPGLRK